MEPVFLLSWNYPNPFNPETAISHDVARIGVVRLSVYALIGQLVRTTRGWRASCRKDGSRNP